MGSNYLTRKSIGSSIFKHDLPVEMLPNGNSLTPDNIYRADGQEIQSTYAPVDREVVGFTPNDKRSFAIVDGAGNQLGTFAHGSVEIRATADQFYASTRTESRILCRRYSNGAVSRTVTGSSPTTAISRTVCGTHSTTSRIPSRFDSQQKSKRRVSGFSLTTRNSTTHWPTGCESPCSTSVVSASEKSRRRSRKTGRSSTPTRVEREHRLPLRWCRGT